MIKCKSIVFQLIVVLFALQLSSAPKSKSFELDEKLKDENLEVGTKASILFEKSKILFDEKRFEDSYVVLKDLQANYNQQVTDFAHFNYYYGVAAYNNSDYSVAVTYLLKAINAGSDSFDYDKQMYLAKSYFSLSKFGLALATLGKAKKDPNFPKSMEYYELVVQSFYNIKEYSKCKAVIEEAVLLFPENRVILEVKDRLPESLAKSS